MFFSRIGCGEGARGVFEEGSLFQVSLDNFLAFILAKTSCEKNPQREITSGGLAA